MASANLRYIALRSRLAAVLESEATQARRLERAVHEIYRALPHYTAIVVFDVRDGVLTPVATHGIDPAAAGILAEGLAAVAARAQIVVFAPDIRQDRRARPLHEDMAGELAVPVHRDGQTTMVLDVQSRRPGGLTFYDREFLTWLAARLVERALAP